MTPETANLERLLAHAEWMRSLARQLVGTASADDVVQETLIAAMQSPPDVDRPPRPWLARVMRNVTRMRFRADSRRAQREELATGGAIDAAIGPRDAAGPEAVVQRLETHRALCELVLGLDEPFRQTLVRHYFDGLTLAAIARADGVPEGTVRWRHKTALERLRTRLDERAGGDRRAWVAGFGPLVAMPPKPLLVAGGLVMNKIIIGSVVAVAGGLVAWRVASGHAAASTSQAQQVGRASGAQAAMTGPTLEAPAAAAGVRAIPKHTLQLPTAAERAQIASRIAAAQLARAPTTTPAPSLAESPPRDPTDLDKEVIRSAMHEVIPFVQECYEQALPAMKAPEFTIKAHLVLTGDPDVGTLIDAEKLVDDHGEPLPAGFDDCLRSTFQTLELPPIGEGDRIDVHYPFLFRQADPDDAGSATQPK